MERMKPDTAPVGIKNRVGQQMIEIDDHGRQHDEPACQPLVPECKPGNSTRDGKMKKDVQDGYGPLVLV